MTTSCHNNTMIAAAVNSHHGVVECADTFPFKLYDMLQAAETYNFDDVVSWGPHGQAFKVHDSRAFAQRILPKYFSGQSRYKSFLRQLNFYKFKRATEGPDKGAYSHEMFKRGQRNLCQLLKRQRRWRPKKNSSSSCSGTRNKGPTSSPQAVLLKKKGGNSTDGAHHHHHPQQRGASMVEEEFEPSLFSAEDRTMTQKSNASLLPASLWEVEDELDITELNGETGECYHHQAQVYQHNQEDQGVQQPIQAASPPFPVTVRPSQQQQQLNGIHTVSPYPWWKKNNNGNDIGTTNNESELCLPDVSCQHLVFGAAASIPDEDDIYDEIIRTFAPYGSK